MNRIIFTIALLALSCVVSAQSDRVKTVEVPDSASLVIFDSIGTTIIADNVQDAIEYVSNNAGDGNGIYTGSDSLSQTYTLAKATFNSGLQSFALGTFPDFPDFGSSTDNGLYLSPLYWGEMGIIGTYNNAITGLKIENWYGSAIASQYVNDQATRLSGFFDVRAKNGSTSDFSNRVRMYYDSSGVQRTSIYARYDSLVVEGKTNSVFWQYNLPRAIPGSNTIMYWQTAATPTFLAATFAGTAFGTTDGSGDIIVTLPVTMVDATYSVVCTSESTTAQIINIQSKTSTTFTARFFDSSGSAITSTGVVLNYHVTDR